MAPFLDIVNHLLDPLIFLLISATYIPRTIIFLLTSLNFSTLLSPKKFQEAWFARFWAVYGPLSRDGATENAAPWIKRAHGVVLEVGSGNGEWIHVYDKTKVTKIYGVEPNREHHAALKRKIIDAGLEDIYVIIPVGIEHLGERWVGLGSVDSIVTIQCLCSIPTPKTMISLLYKYLKAGGQWIVYEHVMTHEGGWVAKYQALVDIIWPTFLGGCSITRDSEKWLRAAGSWSEVELKQPSAEPYYKVIPHVMGVLKK
ncbi:S-adenosyl-L-methionine-dependent methyltransferase [Bisporella sp. PMI_857]|nr:S-adenosyl-L-methionine-dependent methyltransferase [Bisporella sp. PMI_857]